MWIIHIAGKENSELLSKVLSTVPLRFDSHVFGFYEYKDGKKRTLCIGRFWEQFDFMFYQTIEKVDSIIEKCFKIIVISLDKGISIIDINDIYKIASNEKKVRTVMLTANNTGT